MNFLLVREMWGLICYHSKKFTVFTLGLEQIFSSVASLEERWRRQKQGEVPEGNNFSESHTVDEVGGKEEDDKT